MEFNLDQRTASLSVGEFAEFTTGPHDAGSGHAGLWRAQLGTHWHNELRGRAAAETPGAEFELGWGADPELRVHRDAWSKDEEAGMLGSWRTSTRTVREMQRRDLHRAVVTFCVGGGQGVAVLLERD